jgi:hypothetical protein
MRDQQFFLGWMSIGGVFGQIWMATMSPSEGSPSRSGYFASWHAVLHPDGLAPSEAAP